VEAVRRGRALLPHPEVQWIDDEHALITRQVVAFLTGVHVSSLRRNLRQVACHVQTKQPLYELQETKRRLAEREQRLATRHTLTAS
jgi:hypothetical protein